MKTLLANLEPNPNYNCHKILISFIDYAISEGMRFECKIFNESMNLIDIKYSKISGADFQNWPPAPEGQEEEFDSNYIIDKCISYLGLTRII